MRYLGAYVLGEGPSDESFFPPLLERSLDDLCRPIEVYIAPVQSLPSAGEGHVAAVCDAARLAVDSATLFFYHYDGTGDLPRERTRRWEPMDAAWRERRLERPLVPLVPVREMEAWAVADLDLLEDMFGSRWQDADVYELNRLGTPESLTDAKRTLKDIVACRGRRSRRAREVSDFLPLLGERVSLDALERLDSFKSWRELTAEALRELGFFT